MKTFKILGLIFFFPLYVVALPFILIFKTLIKNCDEKTISYLLKGSTGIAIFCLISAMIGFEELELTEDMWIYWLYVISSVIGFIGYLLKKNKVKKYQHYIECIQEKDCFEIQGFANEFGLSKASAKLILYDIIESKMLIGTISKEMFIRNDYITKIEPSVIETKEVQCPSCGAPNKIIAGKESYCEYCETKLK